MSAGRNLITLFSSVNNLSRSFSSPRSRVVHPTRRHQRLHACHARTGRMDARQANAAHASAGAACSNSSKRRQAVADAIAVLAWCTHATSFDGAHGDATRCRISRYTSAFARKLRELFAPVAHRARSCGMPPQRSFRGSRRVPKHRRIQPSPAARKKKPAAFPSRVSGCTGAGDQWSSLSSNSAYSSGASSSLSCSASESSTTNSQPSP